MTRAQGLRWMVAPLGVAALLAVALTIRLALLDTPGHYSDALVMARWAENMAEFGPWHFYEHDGALYPALLYAFWPLGVLLDGADVGRAIKGLSIPFDLAVGLVVYLAARRLVGPGRALIAPALYLFNPAVLLAGPIWGQVDAAGTLAFLAALLALAGGRFGAAGALTVLAGLIKPQFGLVVLPVVVVAVMRWRATGSSVPLVRGALGGAAAYLIVALPLRMDPISYLGRVIESGSFKDMISANAANIWALTVGYRVPDGGFLYVGAVLLLLGLAASLLPLRRRRDLPTILAVGLFVAFAFFFLPTRVHERYLFPAFAVLAPLAAANWWLVVPYLVLTTGFAASMTFALLDTTPFWPGPSLAAVLTAPLARIWISLTLCLTAVAIVVLLVLRPRPGPGASAPRE